MLEEMYISRAGMGFLGEKRHYCEYIMGEERELNTGKKKRKGKKLRDFSLNY